MGDECNVTSIDHGYKKNLNEGNLTIKNNKEHEQPLEIISKPPEYSVQYPVGDTNVDNERVMFSYVSTKLRAEAPPFTPDCTVLTMENPIHTLNMTPINPDYQDHCFVDVNLVHENLIHVPNEEITLPKPYPILKESNIDENIKLTDETSIQPFNSILPEVEITMNARDVVLDSSPSVAIKEEIAPSQYPARSRLLLRRFTFGNSTKIAILFSSIVISLVLLIYIFV